MGSLAPGAKGGFFLQAGFLLFLGYIFFKYFFVGEVSV
jgi:hypothetical protein